MVACNQACGNAPVAAPQGKQANAITKRSQPCSGSVGQRSGRRCERINVPRGRTNILEQPLTNAGLDPERICTGKPHARFDAGFMYRQFVQRWIPYRPNVWWDAPRSGVLTLRGYVFLGRPKWRRRAAPRAAATMGTCDVGAGFLRQQRNAAILPELVNQQLTSPVYVRREQPEVIRNSGWVGEIYFNEIASRERVLCRRLSMQAPRYRALLGALPLGWALRPHGRCPPC